MPPASDNLGDTLKIVQIVFYTVGVGIAFLTYWAAKRGLLNTVNTEYQKRVMDRLQKLSQDLYSEFDLSSPTHWANIKPVHDAIQEINCVFENNMSEILAQRKYYYGIPYTEDVKRLQHLLGPVVSDPFIPKNIRDAVIDLLENRLQVLNGIYICEFEKYADSLAKSKHSPMTELDDVNKIHNKIVEQKNKQGCGVMQIEAEVHEIRCLIHGYFESFNPHRKWWNRRRRPASRTPLPSRDERLADFQTQPRTLHHERV